MAVIFFQKLKGQNAPWTQEASEASGGAQVLDVGQTWRSLHHQVQIRTPQAVRLSAHHSVHQVNLMLFRFDRVMNCCPAVSSSFAVKLKRTVLPD